MGESGRLALAGNVQLFQGEFSHRHQHRIECLVPGIVCVIRLVLQVYEALVQHCCQVVQGGIRRAFAAFMAEDRLNTMRRSAMARSFSWELPAACYSTLYQKTVSP